MSLSTIQQCNMSNVVSCAQGRVRLAVNCAWTVLDVVQSGSADWVADSEWECQS